MTDLTFLIAGGDLRQLYLAKLLSSDNKVYVIGFDLDIAQKYSDFLTNVTFLSTLNGLETSIDYVILPMPATTDANYVITPLYDSKLQIDDLLYVVNNNTVILGGKLSDALLEKCKAKNITIIDYLKREELAVLNAVPTAEGALQIALEETPCTLFGQKVLVTGYGRISKVLSRLLRAFGADVTVCARKYSDLAWININGYTSKSITDLDKCVSEFDIIFNTVPSLIFCKEILNKLKQDCLLIDLASKPGGVDVNASKDLGVKTIWALSLPGKVAPLTSAQIIHDTICNIISERGAT
ncbi:MAG: dipicolinate synthase subunit DpsA [Oscillospiraceae bacterium]|nr:dipicolinate synthase subunit DpsA [Oscillospiraceae bacterium]